ncbi:MAG: hypothetical protein AAF827_17660 [Cyanobacteria bacterium P01_D01_bin.6]
MTATLDQPPQDIVNTAIHGFQTAGQPRPNGTTVTTALLELERTAKRAKQKIPIDALLGTWRLCFSTGKKAKLQSGQSIGSGFYIPKLAIARITFAHSDESEPSLVIKNELQIGPLTVRFTGPARYPGKKNLLVFDFTHLQVRCFGLTMYAGQVGGNQRTHQTFEDVPIGKLPFFAFFAASDSYIAARGRGGGLAIWIHENSGKQ